MTPKEIKANYGDLDTRLKFLLAERDRCRDMRGRTKSPERFRVLDWEIIRLDLLIDEVWDLIGARDKALKEVKK